MSLREWVKFCLHLKGYTFKSFAQKHGVKSGTLYKVFVRGYPRMEKLLAKELKSQPWELWPDRYKKHKRKYQRRRSRSRKILKDQKEKL